MFNEEKARPRYSLYRAAMAALPPPRLTLLSIIYDKQLLDEEGVASISLSGYVARHALPDLIAHLQRAREHINANPTQAYHKSVYLVEK